MKQKHFLLTILIFLLLLVAATTQVHAASDDPIELYDQWDDELKSYLSYVCEEQQLSEPLVLAVIYNESRFRADATNLNANGTTDWGLMQVNDVCFEFVRENCDVNDMVELLDPYTAIDCGTALLTYHKQFTGDDSLALLRYQVGAGRYKSMLANGETTTPTHTFVLEIATIYSNEFERKSHTELFTILRPLNV